MKFFLPDWDDRVDPGYDFLTERGTLKRDPHANDLYAHELLGKEIYDGILISLMALRGKGPKKMRIEQVGLRQYLRLPPSLELFADCGAFGYIAEKQPPFETGQVIELYERFGFNYGVSIDHAVVTEFANQRAYRYELTLRNAEEFVRQYNLAARRFKPVGAIQGWDVHSYVEAAKSLVAMGYDYIAVGGLARSNTTTIAETVRAITASVPATVSVHVFGVGRLSLLPLFSALKIASIDSATPIRQAWLSAHDNYYAGTRTFAAIRIPDIGGERPKPYSLVGRTKVRFGRLESAEQEALNAIREYDKGSVSLKATLHAIIAFDRLLADRLDARDNETRWSQYRETLKEKPWKNCPCPICREIGVEVVIFRGNNRNRRRGFHNLWTLRERLRQLGRVRRNRARGFATRR